MRAKMTGKRLQPRVERPRVICVKLAPQTIAKLERKAARLRLTRHALMREVLEDAAA